MYCGVSAATCCRMSAHAISNQHTSGCFVFGIFRTIYFTVVGDENFIGHRCLSKCGGGGRQHGMALSGDGDDGGSHLDCFAFLCKKLTNFTGKGAWQFYEGLGCFDFYQDIVDVNNVTGLDFPRDNFCLSESFTNVRKIKLRYRHQIAPSSSSLYQPHQERDLNRANK